MDFSTQMIQLSGIGDKTAQKFAAAGIHTIGELLMYFPRTYDVYEEPVSLQDAADGRILAICGFVMRTLIVRRAGGYVITTGTIRTRDEEEVPVTWFNMPYLRSQIKPGTEYIFRGYVKRKGKKLFLTQPKIYLPGDYEALRAHPQPVYPQSGTLTANRLRSVIGKALEAVEFPADYLPEETRKKYELAQLEWAIRQIHFPEDLHHCLLARKRIVFDEFLLFILGLKQMKGEAGEDAKTAPMPKQEYADTVLKILPYSLTGAQQRVWETIRSEMTQGKVMSRLIQGDVGSGKTILAFLSMLLAAENGVQAVMMVPTEVLAKQHYDSFLALTAQAGIDLPVRLLTGSTKAADRREILRGTAAGEISVLIGTHALFQEKVSYHHLGLVITDEQHRFGVRQREALSEKGMRPHILVMSATPIPRTLAVILYADLDLCVLDELPASRLPIKNCVVDTGWREKAWRFIEKETSLGHQAYVICPMVEESEMIEAENVTDYAKTLQEHLDPGVRVAVLHGKMKAAQKDEIMSRFASGQIDVLVSTTVVEVGVNVPNATVMMIEDAQRFGLAQLHQLRGRVGRSDQQSYCIMIDSSGNEETAKRLGIMNKTNDGFEIARKDLELRGPGDLFGVRQSGLIEFKMADVFSDASVLQQAGEAADEIYRKDPGLSAPEHAVLRGKLLSYAGIEGKNLNI